MPDRALAAQRLQPAEPISLVGSSLHVESYYSECRHFLGENGKLMYWWDFGIRDSYWDRLQRQGTFWLYIYRGAPVQEITYRCLVEAFYCHRASAVGIPSPEPRFTLAHEQGKSRFEQECTVAGRAIGKARIPRTWFRIIAFEKLPVPLLLQDFVKYDEGEPIHTSALISAFAYARRRPER